MGDLKKHKLGWIGIGRMGYAMAERLAKAGCDLTVYNRTREKAEPLAKYGAKIVGRPADLAGCDIVFTMVSTGDDVKEVLEGKDGVLAGNGKPKMIVDSTSISIEASAEIRKSLAARGVKLLAAPVTGNAKVIKAGKLTFCVSGPAGLRGRPALSRRDRARASPTSARASSRASPRSATTCSSP